MIVVYNNLGNTLNKIGNKDSYKKAGEYLMEALEYTNIIDKSQKIRPTIALIYLNLGKSYAGLKKYKKAISAYEEGLTYTNSNSPLSFKRQASIYFQLADVFKNKKDIEKVEEYEQKALRAYKRYEEERTKISKS